MFYRFIAGCVLSTLSVLSADQLALSNEDVITLHRSGLGDAPLLSKIKASACRFDTTVSSLSALKQSGLSDGVIDAMISCSPVAENESLTHEKRPLSHHSDTGAAQVYVYRYKQFNGAALEPSVFLDEYELAKMDNGRYFVVTLEAGRHTLRSNDKQSGIQMDVKPGEIYHVRVDIATGFWKGHGRLVSVAQEQGGFEVAKLRPLDSGKIKDRSHVTAPESLTQAVLTPRD